MVVKVSSEIRNEERSAMSFCQTCKYRGGRAKKFGSISMYPCGNLNNSECEILDGNSLAIWVKRISLYITVDNFCSHYEDEVSQ